MVRATPPGELETRSRHSPPGAEDGHVKVSPRRRPLPLTCFPEQEIFGLFRGWCELRIVSRRAAATGTGNLQDGELLALRWPRPGAALRPARPHGNPEEPIS